MRTKNTVLRLQQFKHQEQRRQVAEIEAMVAEFERKKSDLDQQIEVEEQRTGVCDPGHFNYSLTAKSIRNRRDNLVKSIADLKEQFREAKERLEEAASELHKAELLASRAADGSAPPEDEPMQDQVVSFRP